MTPTAAMAYRSSVTNVRALMDALRDAMRVDENAFHASGATDWGYAGSMEHVEELVREALGFLKGNDASTMRTDEVIAA